MKYSTLGRTGLRVSKIGLGTGGKSLLGQNKGLSEADSHRVIHRALDLGINLFDTSPAYGDSEAILGRALRAAKATEKVHVATKVVPVHYEGAAKGQLFRPPEIIASVERSLERLGSGTLDIVLLHAVLPLDYPAVIEQVYPTLARLKESGKVSFIGISEQAVDDPAHLTISQAIQTDLFDVVMLRYTMVHQQAETSIFPTTAQKGIGVMSVCPVDPPLCRPEQLKGWLESLKSSQRLNSEALSADDPVRAWVEAGPAVLAAAAMRFVANHPAVDHIVTGTSNPTHLNSNVRAALEPPLPLATAVSLRHLYGGLAEGRL